MRLSISNIHEFLLDKNLITTKNIVDGDFQAVNHPAGENFFKVEMQPDKKYLIQQVRSFDEKMTHLFRRGATALLAISNLDLFSDLKKHIPEFLSFDSEYHVLINSYLEDYVNLDEYYRYYLKIPDVLYDNLIQIVKKISLPLNSENLLIPSLSHFPRSKPWILQITESSVAENNELYESNYLIYTVYNHPIFHTFLRSTRKKWEIKSLIHGDIKWTNFMVHKEHDNHQVYLIDWEMSDIGDPLWDVAGIFQNIISNIILRNEKELELGYIDCNIELELRDLWEVIGRLWKDYSSRSNVSDSIQKTLDYTAARLLQTASEGNKGFQYIRSNVQKILDTSLYLIEKRDFIMNCIEEERN